MLVATIHRIGNERDAVTLDHIERVIQENPRIMLSFDDGLECQALAFPLLKQYRKTGIFFLNNDNPMERHRMVREKMGIEFYTWFWKEIGKRTPAPDHFLNEYKFYTQEDKDYRWFRDFLHPKWHDKIMDRISEPIKFIDPREIVKEGHVIGLHSATHPRVMGAMKPHEQYDEWMENLAYLRKYQEVIELAAYPMGRYNDVTKLILERMGITMAFTNSTKTRGVFEQPRTDIKNL